MNFLPKSKSEPNARTNSQETINAFVERFGNLFAQTGMTKVEFANVLGIKSAGIGNYLKGKGLPSIPVLCDIADYFHVKLDYLLGRDPWPMKREHFVFYYPEGEFPYSIKRPNSEENTKNGLLTGKLRYSFGMNVVDIQDFRDHKGTQPFLCFYFGESDDDQTLLRYFLNGGIKYACFLLQVSAYLGVQFVGMRSPFLNEYNAFATRLIISSCKELPTDCLLSTQKKEKYFAVEPEDNTLNCNKPKISVCGGPVTGVVEQWLSFSEEEKKAFLMNYIRDYGNLPGIAPAFFK
ncbi:helix-turn-helix domain-containing protein [Acidaminococcus timonensis]|uniref:helix-turn-helix domain-containing protein n=1 Tax=Acidaminococcus TaxID=904 RepID=UPI0008DA8E6B|nr:helix-turn-helix transcriptional regulator [Acidaminococcus timonensis]